MAGGNQVTLTFAGDSRDLERAFTRVGSSARDFDRTVSRVDANVDRRSRGMTGSFSRIGSGLSSLAGVAGVALGGLAVGLTGAAMAGLSFVEAAEESRAVTRQTAAVIKSMGNIAGVTAEEVAELSEKLSLKSGIDDELIQSGQNVLLTFANVRDEVGRGNDIFTRATTAALDMSVALGQDMQSSVTQLGKALNDPIAGISALSRVGVQFTEQQKEMIAMLVAGGDTLGAQKVILAELEAQFSGSAEAQATATDKMSVAFGNLQEAIGEKLLPFVDQFSNWIIDEGLPKTTELWQEFENELIPKFQEIARIVGGPVVNSLKLLGAMWVMVSQQMRPLLESLGRLLSAITGNKDESDDLRQGLKLLGIVFAAAFGPPIAFAGALVFVANQIRFVIDAIAAVIRKIREFFGLLGSIPGRIRDAFQNVLGGGSGGGVGGIVGGVTGALTGLFGAEGGIVTGRGIERFGFGGIVGHSRDTMPAMLSPREAVLTLQDQKNLMGMIRGGRGGSGSTVNVYVAGAIRSDRELVKLIGDELRRGGFDGVGLR